MNALSMDRSIGGLAWSHLLKIPNTKIKKMIGYKNTINCCLLVFNAFYFHFKKKTFFTTLKSIHNKNLLA